MSDGSDNYPAEDPSAFPPPAGGEPAPPAGGMPDVPPQPAQTPPFDGGFQQPVYPSETPPPAQGYQQPGYQQPGYAPGYPVGPRPDNKKVMTGILAILLGGFGVHKFVLGYTLEGIIQIVLTIVTCGIASIIPLIEGIIYLTKSDEEFYQTYQVGRRTWF